MAILFSLTIFFILCRTLLHRGDSTREALLRALVLFVTISVAIREVLRLLPSFHRDWMVAAGSFAVLSSLLVATRALKSAAIKKVPSHRYIVHVPPHPAAIDVSLAALIVIVLVVVGIVAIVAPHSNADSTGFFQYRTAEVLYLNSYFIPSACRLFNLIGVLSLVGSAVAASLIAGKFGAYRTAQLLAALFVVTIPGAAFQSNGCVVATFWIITAAYFTLRAVKDQTPIDVLTVASASGLALFAYGPFFLFLFCVIMGCSFFRPGPRRTWMLKRIPFILFVPLALNISQFIRAYRLIGAAREASLFITRSKHTALQTDNLPHLILVLLALTALPFTLQKLEVKHRSVVWYLCGVAFGVIALIVWQPWIREDNVLVFALAAAPFGIIADRILTARLLVICVAMLLVVSAFLNVSQWARS